MRSVFELNNILISLRRDLNQQLEMLTSCKISMEDSMNIVREQLGGDQLETAKPMFSSLTRATDSMNKAAQELTSAIEASLKVPLV